MPYITKDHSIYAIGVNDLVLDDRFILADDRKGSQYGSLVLSTSPLLSIAVPSQGNGLSFILVLSKCMSLANAKDGFTAVHPCVHLAVQGHIYLPGVVFVLIRFSNRRFMLSINGSGPSVVSLLLVRQAFALRDTLDLNKIA